MNKGGRPISTGSVVDAEGGVRAYLHIKRLRDVAAKLEGKDQTFVLLAVEAMQALSRRNQVMGRRIGNFEQKRKASGRGLSFARDEAAEAIAELAADGAVTAYIGRTDSRVRVIRNGRLPRGARLIGTYDAGCDYRHIAEDLAA